MTLRTRKSESPTLIERSVNGVSMALTGNPLGAHYDAIWGQVPCGSPAGVRQHSPRGRSPSSGTYHGICTHQSVPLRWGGTLVLANYHHAAFYTWPVNLADPGRHLNSWDLSTEKKFCTVLPGLMSCTSREMNFPVDCDPNDKYYEWQISLKDLSPLPKIVHVELGFFFFFLRLV